MRHGLHDRVRHGLHYALWDCFVLQRRDSNQRLTRKTLSVAGARGAWKRWKREREIVALLPMVDRIARNVRWMFAEHLDFRDLVQAGTVGLVNAANAYQPGRGAFEPYAYFRVRGAIIDSQKRRTYREERNVSLQAIAAANAGWLPPALDTDAAALPDEQAEHAEIHAMLWRAIDALPAPEQTAIRGQLAGQSLGTTARQMGRSLTWTRAKLADARTMVGVSMRGA